MSSRLTALLGLALLGGTARATENDLDEDAEERSNEGRKAWFEQLHRAPPGVDWRAVERQNAAKLQAQRNARMIRPALAAAGDSGARWVERGSDNQAGRIRVGALSPDGSALYAGSDLGGVWRGTPDGEDWTPLGDNLYGGVHALVVLPGETSGGPDTILASTGSPDLVRSTDDGATWVTPDGLSGLSDVRRLVATADGAVFALIKGRRGYNVLRSDDNGTSFAEVLDLGSFAGDLWIPRDGTVGLYVMTADGLEYSEDYGDHFTLRAALPQDASSAALSGSEAGAPRLWVALTKGGTSTLYRSDDAGTSWASVTDMDDFWGTLGASIDHPNSVGWGGIELHWSDDGGATFGSWNAWWDYYASPEDTLHADLWNLDAALDADGAEVWFIGTDGGLYRSTDALGSVENVSLHGLRVGQYYSTLTSVADPTHIAAGAQDQGYQVSNDLPQEGDLYQFDQETSGDYGHLTSSDGTHGFVYSVYPGSLLVQIGEETPNLGYGYFPNRETYAWLPPIVADPDDPEAFFFPGQKIYRYTRSGRVWSVNDYSDQDFADSGYEYISALVFSPLNPDRAYAVTSVGRFFVSDDHALTWTERTDSGISGQYFYGTSLLASAEDQDTITVGGSGYAGSPVYRSTDAGLTWTRWGEGLPNTLVYCLGESPDGTDTLFAGTEQAAYRSEPGTGTWTEITGTDAPATTYWSVETLRAENTMRFATYGRGIWDYQLDPEHTGCYPVQDYDADGAMCDLDCDDHDAARVPGMEDACGDSLDADCDGTDPTCPPSDTGGKDTGKDSGGTCGCASGTQDSDMFGLIAMLATALGRRRRV